MSIRIVHLDDDEIVLERFSQIVNKGVLGRSVSTESVATVDEFMSRVKDKKHIDVALIDVFLEGETKTGLELAEFVHGKSPQTVILMVSSTRDIKTVRGSLKAGADDFVSKDVKPQELIARIEAALEAKASVMQARDIDSNGTPSLTVAGSTIASIKLRVPAIIQSAVNCIYVEGESGTGKEVVANLFAARLAKGVPFVRLNCGAITPSLLASELFGHVKGSFTGASADKPGLIEAADGGWIFLDEVATLPMDAQIALLRAIDNQAIRRIGANNERPVQFRVISATNESLQDLVADGKFRRDLWQRLRETYIKLPPLRSRKHEIPELIDFFLGSMRGGPYQLAPAVEEALTIYDWNEGNIRELRNCLRAMTEKSVNGVLTPKSIPEHIWEAIETSETGKPKSATVPINERLNEIRLSWTGTRPTFELLSDQLLLEILNNEYRNHGPLSLRAAGKALGIPKSTISSKLKRLVENKLIGDVELQQMMKTGAQGDD